MENFQIINIYIASPQQGTVHALRMSNASWFLLKGIEKKGKLYSGQIWETLPVTGIKASMHGKPCAWTLGMMWQEDPLLSVVLIPGFHSCSLIMNKTGKSQLGMLLQRYFLSVKAFDLRRKLIKTLCVCREDKHCILKGTSIVPGSP